MGLFGKSKQDQNRELALAAEEEQKRAEEKNKAELFQQLAQKQENIRRLSGSKAASNTEISKSSNQFKFVLTDEEYVLYPIPQKSTFELRSQSIEEIQEYINRIQPIVLKREDYTCELIENQLPLEKNQKYVGEGIIRISPIRILFKNISNNTEIVLDVENNPDNIMPLAEFFKGLGVKNYYNVLDIPEEMMSLNVLEGNGFLNSEKTYLVYRNKGVLTLICRNTYSTKPTMCVVEIGLDEILYYKSEGSVRYEQMVSGSGGAENSYTGAIVGGLLFGATGALIGSRANETKTEISTKTIKHDDRILILSVKRDSVVYSISLDLTAEPVLEWLIPEKQYDYVIQKRREMYEKDPLA